MNLRLVTAPVAEPVSLETAKSFLRVDGTDSDPTIVLLNAAAREKGEELARRAFITQTWDMTVDTWPVDLKLKIYRPPLQSVTSVKYFDSNNVEHTFTDYVVDNRNEPGVIIFNTLPGDALLESGAITVRFVAGFGDAGVDVPDRIKKNILALMAYWFENREAQDVPGDLKRAFMAERVVWF